MTNWPPPWSRVLLEKLILPKPVKKLSKFPAKRMFITVFKRATTCPCQKSEASGPNPPIHVPRDHFNIIPQYSPRFPSDLITSCFPFQVIYAFSLLLIRATFPSHLTLLFDPPTNIIWGINLKFYIVCFFTAPCYCVFLRPKHSPQSIYFPFLWVEKGPVMKMKREVISFSFFQVMEHWWNEIDRGKPKSSGKKTYPSATLSTTNPKRTDQGFFFFYNFIKIKLINNFQFVTIFHYINPVMSQKS
jgi:hypothetical protein